MKKIIALILTLAMTLSLSACMSKEEKAQIEKLEADAVEYMEDYLDDKYPSFSIEHAEQLVAGNFLEGYQIQDVTKLLVKDGKKRYVFCYDRNNDHVYSNVNYDKIIQEFEIMLKEDSTLAKSIKNDTQIKCYDLQVVLDSHKTLKDILSYVKKNNEKNNDVYQFTSTHYFKEQKDFKPSKFKIENLFDNIYNLEIRLLNTIEDFTDTQNNQFEYIDIIEYQDVFYQARNERVIRVNHTHHDMKKVDDIIFVYDARYIDFNVNKTEDYIDYNLEHGNIIYSPMYRGYQYNLKVKDGCTINGTSFSYPETTTKGGCKVVTTDKDLTIVSMYVDAKKYENCAIYNHKKGKFEDVHQYNKYQAFHFYEHNGDTNDVISFMKIKED